MRNRFLIGAILIAVSLAVLWQFAGSNTSPTETEPSSSSQASSALPIIESDETAKAPLNFDHVWKETTVTYDPTCSDGCVELLNRRAGAHGGGGKLSVDPNVNDPIAQWGDCVGSIMSCYESRVTDESFNAKREAAMHACVLESACPAECRDHYRASVEDNMARVNATLESVFLGERAACLPTEAWIE